MKFKVQTKGHYDFVNITENVARAVKESHIETGVAVIFVPGSTAALTTMEYESGLIEDLKKVFESLAPETAEYKHHKRWGDKNGAAHIKSALIGADIVIPIVNKELQLGTWQQVVLIDFDERSRTREVIVQVIKTENGNENS